MLQGGTLVANRRGFAFAQIGVTGRHAGGLDSGTVRGAATLIVRPTRDHLIALYLGGGAQRRPSPGAEFDLGLTTGPRAFPIHAFTGDRMYQGTAEYQYTLTRDALGAGLASLGLATFVDRGGAWFAGNAARHGTDAGVGLRLGSPRVPSTNGLLRVDLAYRFRNDALRARWIASIGSGFPFEVPR
jgi:outer membrane protein assembly factor BamA